MLCKTRILKQYVIVLGTVVCAVSVAWWVGLQVHTANKQSVSDQAYETTWNHYDNRGNKTIHLVTSHITHDGHGKIDQLYNPRILGFSQDPHTHDKQRNWQINATEGVYDSNKNIMDFNQPVAVLLFGKKSTTFVDTMDLKLDFNKKSADSPHKVVITDDLQQIKSDTIHMNLDSQQIDFGPNFSAEGTTTRK